MGHGSHASGVLWSPTAHGERSCFLALWLCWQLCGHSLQNHPAPSKSLTALFLEDSRFLDAATSKTKAARCHFAMSSASFLASACAQIAQSEVPLGHTHDLQHRLHELLLS